MSEYNLGIIDGQYILRRNLAMQAKYGKANENLLLKSFLQSIMKEKRDLDFEKVLICFDRQPYFRQLEGIEEYKADRHYTNQEEVEKLRERLLWEDDPEKIAELEKMISYKDTEAWNNSISAKVKYFIIDEMGKFGFYSLIKSHFEADDISFAIAERCPSLGLKAIMVSVDHDWVQFRNKNVKYTTPEQRGKRNERLDTARYLVGLSKSTGVPVYECGIIQELYKNSHNNVKSYEFCDMVPLEEFITKIYNHDSTLPDYDKMIRRYHATNIRKHLPELDKLINFSLSRTDLASPEEWQRFLNERQINISWSTYERFRRNCNKNLLESSKPSI